MPIPTANPERDPRMRRGFIIGASVVVLLLIVSLFGLTSLNLPFISPSDSQQTILLFVLSTIIFLGLVIFGFILFRSLLKLYLERRAKQLGSKFKTKLVCGALGLSLLPVCFLFLFSYSLINRTLDKWFSRPYETIGLDSRRIVDVLRSYAQSKISGQAQSLAAVLVARTAVNGDSLPGLREEFSRLPRPDGVDYLAVLDSSGAVLMERRFDAEFPALSAFPEKDLSQTLKLSPRLLELNDSSYALAGSPIAISRGRSGTLIVGDSLPKSVSESAARLDQEKIGRAHV